MIYMRLYGILLGINIYIGPPFLKKHKIIVLLEAIFRDLDGRLFIKNI